MDPVAHTLTGAALAEAGLKKKTALATATLVIGANIPDVDAIAMFFGSDTSLLLRRGWTHGIVALLIWPFLLTGLMLLYDFCRQRYGGRFLNPSARNLRRVPLRVGSLLTLSFVSVWSHPFLDWLNTYGIRLLMPFDGTWFYGDTLFIVDPWVWLLMAASVVMTRSGSTLSATGWLLAAMIATALIYSTPSVPLPARVLWLFGLALIVLARWQKGNRLTATLVARAGLLSLGCYLLFMFTGSRMTASYAGDELLRQGIEVNQVFANPLPARPGWRSGLAVTDSLYYRFRMNWLNRSSFMIEGDPIPRKQPDRVVEAALRSDDIQGFVNWMRFPVYEVLPLDEGWRVIIRDLRYADMESGETSGIGVVVVDIAGSEVEL